MKLRVLLFAGAAEAIGADSVEIEVAPHATYNDVGKRLGVEFPQLAELVSRSRLASGRGYAEPNSTVDFDSEVALIPPVSGG